MSHFHVTPGTYVLAFALFCLVLVLLVLVMLAFKAMANQPGAIEPLPGVTKYCHDDGLHVFQKDGSTTGSGVSCALCDCDYGAWLHAFYPDVVPRRLNRDGTVKDFNPC